MRPRPADQQGCQWFIDALEEGIGQANGQGDTQRVAIAGAVLGGDPARLVGDAHAGGAAFPLQLVEPFATNPAGLCVSGRQVAKPAQEVGGLIDVARPAFLQQPLQLQLERLDGAGVEKFAKFLGAEQLGQQLLVERQRLRPPLRQWRVALVHVLPDVVEHQGRREGRGALGVDHDRADLPCANGAHQVTQAVHVEDVAQALPVGLDQDGELGVLAGDLQQVMAALALLPERRALTGTAPRQQQCAGCVLAESRGKERRPVQLRRH